MGVTTSVCVHDLVTVFCQLVAWASYQLHKIACCACGCRQRFPCHRLQRKPLVSDLDMDNGTCVTHVPWCMSIGIANPRWRGTRSRHCRRMRNPQFYVSGERPMGTRFSEIAKCTYSRSPRDVTRPDPPCCSVVCIQPFMFNRGACSNRRTITKISGSKLHDSLGAISYLNFIVWGWLVC